jgi:(p)ppGpp synthase/HD superfamily hydrolase
MLKKAVEIAVRAHEGQRDKGGHPYIAHPLRVMLAVGAADEALASVAVLHDVVEDSEVTLADLAKAGFPPRVTEALALLNHARGEPYMKYVASLAENPDARRVKLADLEDNLDLSRLPGLPSEADLRRMRTYEAARDLLLSLIDSTP